MTEKLGPAPTVRVQPDGFILEIGRDGENMAMATMACVSYDDAAGLAESFCNGMRDAYWWRVFPVIFGGWPTGPHAHAAPAHSENSASRDLAAPADSPKPSPPRSAPEIKPDPAPGPRKSNLSRGPHHGECLNCGAGMEPPIDHVTEDYRTLIAWCAECGTRHTLGDLNASEWSYAVPALLACCPWCQLQKRACACVGFDGKDQADP